MDAAGDLRISAVMSSRQHQAKDFVERYFMRHGVSPTLGEIAAGIGVSKKRAHVVVHAIARKGTWEIVAGEARGIRLVDRTLELSENEVLARLLAAGWTIGDGNRIIQPGGLASTVTEKGLFALPLLDHAFGSDQAGSDEDGKTDQGRRARA